ncbi:MAG: penicillin acylase family protein [Actinomycetes bacterium]
MSRLRLVLTSLLVLGVVVVVVLAISVTALVRRPLPDYSATVKIPGLGAKVEVLRDDRGVPQVYADNPVDLFRAQGYVTAQDRFFQMDYRRHVTAGRLSELVGEDQDALQADRLVRTLGWRRVAEAELPLLAPETREYLQAYADGVNDYIAERSPSDLSVAYTILGTRVDLERIEPWDPVDSLAWLKALAWDLRANYDEELGRALAYGAVGDEDQVAQLYPDYPYARNAPIIPAEQQTQGAALAGPARADGHEAPPPAGRTAGDASSRSSTADDGLLAALRPAAPALESARAALDAVPDLVGAGDGVGSNSWVISGEHTKTGMPLLANDPHLAPQVPSTWYQVGLHCRTVDDRCPFDVAGFSFAGLPGVVIGHNQSIAWAMTSMGADVTDFFLERVNGDTYLRDGAQVPLDVRTEQIKVAGGATRTVTIRSTVHGPLLSDVLPDVREAGRTTLVPPNAPIQGSGYEVSLAWTALTPGRTADAIFALDSARGWDDFRAAAALFEVPAQNLLYADTEGNIGYQAPGKIPVRKPGTLPGQQDGTWPRAGWDSGWDWAGYISFDDLPRTFNPPEGFIVAANQAVTGPGYPYVLTRDFDYGYRSQRIRTVIEGWIADGHK